MSDKSKLTRRHFLQGCGGLLLLAGGGWAFGRSGMKEEAVQAVRQMQRGESMDARFVRQIITKDSGASRTIMWQSAAEQREAAIEYRLLGQEEAQAAPASNEPFDDDGVHVVLHSGKLENLEPGQEYEYRLTNGEESGNWHKLATDDGGSFKALIFPDSQSSDYTDWQNLAQAAWQRNPDAAFFVNMGDLVDNGEDHTQWNAWFNALEGMMDVIPVVPVMGNHETYDQKWEVRWPEAYLREFDVPENGSRDFERHYYSFDYGPVHFSVLNTQWDELDDFKQGILDEQLAWLPEDIKASSKKWKVVLLHKDVLQYRIHNRPERKEGISEVGQIFMPVFEELGIDLVLSAHLHTYRDRGHIQNFQSSRQGPFYILTGVAGNVRYPNLWIDHALDRKVAPQPETDNYLTLEADEDALRVQCFLPDGTVIDDARITKA